MDKICSPCQKGSRLIGTHPSMMTLLVTGGAGFIGSELVRQLIAEGTGPTVINVDKLTYAGNLAALEPVWQSPRHHFAQVDICDAQSIRNLLDRYMPDTIVHLASETHVDRSIDGPKGFVYTNIIGTYTLLEAAREYCTSLPIARKARFRFLHVSTDEVFGSIGPSECSTESSPYRPSSPYAASKAAADHLVRAWQRTYDLPVLISHCCNNFGPNQFPEKLVPLMILTALEERSLPVYGDGQNVRDWLYVEDHCRAIRLVLAAGKIGESYNVGARNQRTNLEVITQLCLLLDELRPRRNGKRYHELITFVPDRPGHDRRYAVDPTRITEELGWIPRESFESALRKTVQWYLSNLAWCDRARNGSYQGERLGVLR